MSKIELKRGRPVLAWQRSTQSHTKEGYWVMQTMHGTHLVEMPDSDGVFGFDFVKPDLDSTPMIGDNVIGKVGYNGMFEGILRGKHSDGSFIIENKKGVIAYCVEVTFEISLKIEKVKNLLKNKLEPHEIENLTTEIFKIIE